MGSRVQLLEHIRRDRDESAADLDAGRERRIRRRGERRALSPPLLGSPAHRPAPMGPYGALIDRGLGERDPPGNPRHPANGSGSARR